MSLAIPFEQIRPDDARIVGGKALALTRLVAERIPVPAGLCVSTLAYRRYLTETRLGLRLRRELRRKPFEDMRWEELWDTALRIRAMFGELVWKDVGLFRERESFLRLLLEMANTSPTAASVRSEDVDQLRTRFLDRFPTERKEFAAELLNLARASYQLRDDDNIHLARIEAQFLAAETEGRRRLDGESNGSRALADAVQRFAVRPDLDHGKDRPSDFVDPEGQWTVYSRQLLGQPAGPGVATGLARIVESAADLFEFRRGEVLVCDAVDPNMTLVVPLAAAIVERRGGMLIHGAIIAREYGLPCVTGVAEATTRIRTGDRLDVDGQLGLVVCTRRS